MILGQGADVDIANPDVTFTLTPPAGPNILLTPVAGIPGSAGVALGVTYPIVSVASFSTAHAFGRYPVVVVVDASGFPVETDVEYPDATHVAVTWPAPFVGTVILT